MSLYNNATTALLGPRNDDGKPRMVIAYCRSATGDTRDIEVQTDRIVACCQQHGYALGQVFVDSGKGGHDLPGMVDLLAHCTDHPGTLVIATDATRICRSIAGLHEVLAATRSRHGSWLFVDGASAEASFREPNANADFTTAMKRSGNLPDADGWIEAPRR